MLHLTWPISSLLLCLVNSSATSRLVQNGAVYIFIIFIYRNFKDKKILSTSGVRQWANRVAFGGASFCLLICGRLTNAELAFFFMVLCLFFFGAVQSGLSCSYMEVSPKFSGIMNTVGKQKKHTSLNRVVLFLLISNARLLGE